MAKAHIKKGDEVVVLAGADRGKRGRVLQVLTTQQRAVVEGIRMIKRHTRKNQSHPNGAIVEREGTIHISNLMRAENFDARASRRGVTPATEEKAES
jgi:large subunit ribosomal protein L24